MRLSVDRFDPGFNPRLANKACPYLNGKCVRHVVTADEDLGIIVKYVTDNSGNIVLDYIKKEIVREQLHGEVSIRLNRKLVVCPKEL